MDVTYTVNRTFFFGELKTNYFIFIQLIGQMKGNKTGTLYRVKATCFAPIRTFHYL